METNFGVLVLFGGFHFGSSGVLECKQQQPEQPLYQDQPHPRSVTAAAAAVAAAVAAAA